MRNIFGWSLPPGCTTLPGDEPDALELRMAHRCKCGAFLPNNPERTEPWEDATECDGKVEAYDQPYDEGSIQILGEEYRGKTYKVYVASCGAMLKNANERHAPHREVHNAGTTGFYRCGKCNHLSKKDYA